jgi:hypothetical protein
MRSIMAAFLLLAIAGTADALPPPLPHIARLTPDSGSIAGGEAVLITIDHVYLIPTYGVTVEFDGSRALRAIVVDDHTVGVITPKHVRGTVDVSVRIFYLPSSFGDVAGGGQTYSYTSDEPIHFADYEPVLLPVVVWESGESLVGADGARWTTNLTISNNGGHDVEIVYGEPPRIRNVHAGEWTNLWRNGDDRAAGAIVYVARSGAAHVALSLHVVSLYAYIDTEVPPVREHELRGGAVDLPGVRYSYGGRGTLRVYDVNATPGAAVNVKAYDGRNVLLASVQLPLSSPPPGYASYGSLDVRDALNLVAGGTYRLVVEPVSSSPMRLWAFVASPDDGGGHIRTTTPH